MRREAIAPPRRAPQTLCGWPTCLALVDKHEFCPVHSPLAVLTRAKAIVQKHFALLQTVNPLDQEALDKTLADIVRDLENTV